VITSASRIQDLEHVLDAHKLTMTATATGGLWTVVLDTRFGVDPHQHFIGSGGSLFEATARALDKMTRTVFVEQSRGRK
jgi:hypothetical protein